MTDWVLLILIAAGILFVPAALVFGVLYLGLRSFPALSQARMASLIGAACGVLGALGTDTAFGGASSDEPGAIVFLLLLPIVLTWLPALLLVLRGGQTWARVLAAGLLKVDAILAACAMLGLIFLGWASTQFDEYVQEVQLLMIAGWVVMAVALIVVLAVVRIESDVAPHPVFRPTD